MIAVCPPQTRQRLRWFALAVVLFQCGSQDNSNGETHATAPPASHSPCSGWVKDKLDHPKDQSLPKPAPGESYTDPAFGTKITRITAADPSEGGNAVIKTNYSTMPAWNADGSLILLWHRGGRKYEIYEGDEPYTHLTTFSPGASRVNTDIEQILWDPVDPHVLYWPANYNAHPRFWRATLSPPDWTAEYELVRDFGSAPTNCPDGNWGSLLSLGNDPHVGSLGPRKIVGLMCGDAKFLYSIAEDAVLAMRTRKGKAASVAPSERKRRLLLEWRRGHRSGVQHHPSAFSALR